VRWRRSGLDAAGEENESVGRANDQVRDAVVVSNIGAGIVYNPIRNGFAARRRGKSAILTQKEMRLYFRNALPSGIISAQSISGLVRGENLRLPFALEHRKGLHFPDAGRAGQPGAYLEYR
jgi:hypothetical protein